MDVDIRHWGRVGCYLERRPIWVARVAPSGRSLGSPQDPWLWNFCPKSEQPQIQARGSVLVQASSWTTYGWRFDKPKFLNLFRVPQINQQELISRRNIQDSKASTPPTKVTLKNRPKSDIEQKLLQTHHKSRGWLQSIDTQSWHAQQNQNANKPGQIVWRKSTSQRFLIIGCEDDKNEKGDLSYGPWS